MDGFITFSTPVSEEPLPNIFRRSLLGQPQLRPVVPIGSTGEKTMEISRVNAVLNRLFLEPGKRISFRTTSEKTRNYRHGTPSARVSACCIAGTNEYLLGLFAPPLGPGVVRFLAVS
jgi:hypothetical protein